MAFGLKYKLTFDDIHPIHSAIWEVEFYFDGYLGDVIELTGSGTPLVITRGENGQDRMNPIVGSKAEIEIIIDDNFDKEQFFVQQFKIKVNILRAGDLWWSGYVKPDYCEFPYSPAPYSFKIVATDGIALLKNNLVDLSDIKKGTGYVSILNLLMEKGLFQTKHSTNNFRTLSSLHRGDKTQTFDNLSTRFELWVDDKKEFMNIYDILVQIATSFTGRLFFDNGFMWFQRIADLVNPDPTIWQYYDSSVAPDKITLTEPFIKILKGEVSSAEMIYVNNDSFITIMSAYKQSLIDLNYKFRTWLKNGDWHDWDGSDFTNWERFVVDGEGSDFHIDQHGDGTKDSPYTAFLPKYSAGTAYISQMFDDVPNNGILQIDFTAKFLNTTVFAYQIHLYYKDDSGTYHHMAYWDAASFWALPILGSTSPGGESAHVPVHRGSQSQETTVSITTQNMQFHWSDTPINAVQFIIIDPDLSAPDHEDFTGIEVGEVKLSVITNGYIGETDTARTGKDYSKYNEVENYTIIDNVTGNIANSLYYEGEEQSQIWSSDEIPYAINSIQAMALRSTMNIYNEPFELMSGTYFSNTVHFFNTIQRAFGKFKLFMQLYDEYDVRHCKHNMTLAEIKKTIGNDSGYSYDRKFKTDN